MTFRTAETLNKRVIQAQAKAQECNGNRDPADHSKRASKLKFMDSHYRPG